MALTDCIFHCEFVSVVNCDWGLYREEGEVSGMRMEIVAAQGFEKKEFRLCEFRRRNGKLPFGAHLGQIF